MCVSPFAVDVHLTDDFVFCVLFDCLCPVLGLLCYGVRVLYSTGGSGIQFKLNLDLNSVYTEFPLTRDIKE